MSDTTKVDELTDLPDNHGNRLAMDRGLLDELLASGRVPPRMVEGIHIKREAVDSRIARLKRRLALASFLPTDAVRRLMRFLAFLNCSCRRPPWGSGDRGA